MNEVMQAPASIEKSLPELVAAIMQEDIQLSGRESALNLRQPPIDDDDDNWDSLTGTEYSPEKWLYAAESVIAAIDRYRSRHEA